MLPSTSTDAEAHMFTRLVTSRPFAVAVPLEADPPLPLDCASPELASPAPQLARFAASVMTMLIGLKLSPCTTTEADDRRSMVF